MGLDSVELIFTVEQYFNIHIPDAEVEKIGTVENLVGYINARMGLLPNEAASSLAYQIMHDSLLNCLKQLLPQQVDIVLATPLRELVGFTGRNAAIIQQHLKASTKLEAPTLLYDRPVGKQSMLFRFFRIGSRQEPHQVPTTFADLLGWLLAANYKTVFKLPWLSSYDVQQATIGLISECSGVPIPEIQLTDSFTNGLGIN